MLDWAKGVKKVSASAPRAVGEVPFYRGAPPEDRRRPFFFFFLCFRFRLGNNTQTVRLTRSRNHVLHVVPAGFRILCNFKRNNDKKIDR